MTHFFVLTFLPLFSIVMGNLQLEKAPKYNINIGCTKTTYASACYDSPFAHNTTINQPIPTSPTEKKPNWQPPPAETYYKPDEYILKTITHTICIPTVVTSVISEKIPYPTTTSTSVKPIMPTASAPSQTDKYKQLYPNFTGAASRIRYSGILIGVACAIVFLL